MISEHEKMVINKYDLLFESRLTKVESALETLDVKFDRIDIKINHLEKTIFDHIKEIKSDLRWMFGIMITFSCIILGLMAKGFHWY